MKKLLMAAMLVGAMVATAADEGVKKEAPAPAATEAARRPRISGEQRAKMREQRQKAFAARKAEMEAKLLEIIKKYGLEDEKAKALLAELQEAMRFGRRAPRKPQEPTAK